MGCFEMTALDVFLPIAGCVKVLDVTDGNMGFEVNQMDKEVPGDR